MGLKEKIENNIIVILIGVVIATSGVVYSLNSYFNEKKIDDINSKHVTEIRELQSKILSIDRNIGSEKYFDIRSFIYTGQKENPDVEFLSKSGFYANTKLANFDFEENNEIEFLKKILHVTQDDIKEIAESNPQYAFLVSEEYLEISKNAPIYSWVSKDSISYSESGDKKVSRQYMTAQILSRELVSKALNLGANIALKFDQDEPIKSSTFTELKKNVDIQDTLAFNELEDLKKTLNGILESDFISLYFWSQLNFRFATVLQTSEQVRIEKLQKLGNVLYMKLTKKTPNCKNNDGKDVTYFETEELFLISNGKNFYQVRSVIPGFEPLPKSEKLANLNIWLNDLKFITD